MVSFRTSTIDEAIHELKKVEHDLEVGNRENGGPLESIRGVVALLRTEFEPLTQHKADRACILLKNTLDAASTTDSYDKAYIVRSVQAALNELCADEDARTAMTAVFTATKYDYFNPQSVQITLHPSVPYPENTNNLFWSKSPYLGEIKLRVSSLVAQSFFRGGQQYAVTFTDLHTFGGTVDGGETGVGQMAR